MTSPAFGPKRWLGKFARLVGRQTSLFVAAAVLIGFVLAGMVALDVYLHNLLVEEVSRSARSLSYVLSDQTDRSLQSVLSTVSKFVERLQGDGVGSVERFGIRSRRQGCPGDAARSPCRRSVARQRLHRRRRRKDRQPRWRTTHVDRRIARPRQPGFSAQRVFRCGLCVDAVPKHDLGDVAVEPVEARLRERRRVSRRGDRRRQAGVLRGGPGERGVGRACLGLGFSTGRHDHRLLPAARNRLRRRRRRERLVYALHLTKT